MAIASFAALATVNFTTVLAGIWIVSPVAGLRPMRALRLTSFSFPTPGNVKAPDDLVLEIAKSARLASRSVACFLVRPFASATAVAVCDFVNGLSDISFLILQVTVFFSVVMHYWESVVRAACGIRKQKNLNK